MPFEQPYDHIPTITVEFTQDQVNTIVCALAIDLTHYGDKCSKTIADGSNMLIARILNSDDYYIQLKEIHKNL